MYSQWVFIEIMLKLKENACINCLIDLFTHKYVFIGDFQKLKYINKTGFFFLNNIMYELNKLNLLLTFAYQLNAYTI